MNISGSGGQYSGLSEVVAPRERPAAAVELVREAPRTTRPVRIASATVGPVEVAPVEVAPVAGAPGLLGRARDWWDGAPLLHRGAVVGAGLLLVVGVVVALKPAARNPPRRRAARARWEATRPHPEIRGEVGTCGHHHRSFIAAEKCGERIGWLGDKARLQGGGVRPVSR